MQETLTIQEKLKDLRIERGLTLEQLAEQTGLSKSALGSYESDDCKDIGHISIVMLAKFYNVSTDYLLGTTEVRKSENAELGDLHITDGMIALLKGGQINNRLLCELAQHKDFPKLLADMEIYIDGIASMQLQSLNVVVDVARASVMEKYHPGENDKYMRLLEAAHIDETGYFSQIIYRDMDGILDDIKQVHRKDSTSAPEFSIVDQLKAGIQDAAEYKGNPMEKQVRLWCSSFSVDYDTLTPIEFQVLTGILRKSKIPILPKGGRRYKRKR